MNMDDGRINRYIYTSNIFSLQKIIKPAGSMDKLNIFLMHARIGIARKAISIFQ